MGMDMFFPEADHTSLGEVRKDFEREFGTRINLQGIPPNLMDNDKAFADILASGHFVLGYKFFLRTRKMHPVAASCTRCRQS